MSLVLFSCADKKSDSPIFTEDLIRQERLQEEARAESERLRIEELKEEKKREWQRIEIFAKETYQNIKPIIDKKCFDCHHEKAKIPIYGRIFRRRNPVFLHLKDGIEAIDFSREFPLRTSDRFSIREQEPEVKASTQISYLKAINEEVEKRSMPLKSYTFVYPKRKVFKSDEERILGWTQPLIKQMEEFKDKYRSLESDNSPAGKITRLFEAKCFRCHANGQRRGGFGNMEDLEKLKKSKYVEFDNPENSELYTISVSGRMPINPKERLTQEELDTILDWVREE